MKYEFSVKDVVPQRQFERLVKKLQAEFKELEANTNQSALSHHLIYTNIFKLPDIKKFGDEQYLGDLHFYDHQCLRQLAQEAIDEDDMEQSCNYLKQAMRQLNKARSCYTSLSDKQFGHLIKTGIVKT